MIIPCSKNNIDDIFDYIGKDYGKCLYIYIDLKQYGIDDENFNVWIQYNIDSEISAIISEYYGGIQVYSKFCNFDVKEIANFIIKRNPNVIFGMEAIIDKIHELLTDYDKEIGVVGELIELNYPPNPEVYSASIEELEDIVKIISQDENIGKAYGFESLYNQYVDRKINNFGRNYVLRDDSGEIICHAGTYAELPELAVIGGVITNIPYRGKGFSKGTLATLCSKLKSEKKDVFSYFYIPSASKMHYGVGFKKIGGWAKLFK